MKIYAVGGAVRDELLGRAVKDRDYVVVGATPQDMVRLGFRPVGKDFPVFLHPQTQEEYALARTERKTGRGYTGFRFHAAPDVTLEQDLARRDLTINALARDEEGRLIDPHGGLADLRAGLLRHVSPAFAEDPVRVLRVARFAARFGFHVAAETLALMREMARNGEVDALVPERVWQELARGLMEAHPARMFETLGACDALHKVLPQWAQIDERRALAAVEIAAAQDAELPVRYAVLWRSASDAVAAAASERIRASGDCRDLALLATRFGAMLGRDNLDDARIVTLLQQTDALRRPARFEALLSAWACDAEACGIDRATIAARRQHWARMLTAVQGVDGGAVARAYPDRIAEALRDAREAAVGAARDGPLG